MAGESERELAPSGARPAVRHQGRRAGADAGAGIA
jgi:hypothetical protein